MLLVFISRTGIASPTREPRFRACGSLAGLGNCDVTITIDATASLTTTLVNPGQRHSCFITGFAVFMRYVCMDTLRLTGEDRQTREVIERAEAMLKTNRMPFLRTFTNADGAGEKEPRLKDATGKPITPSDQPVMYSSAMLRLWKDNGGNDWLRRFFRLLRDCPAASETTREGALQQCWNWYVAASIAARRDLSPLFADDWRLPVSAEARKILTNIDWKQAGRVKAGSTNLFSNEDRLH